MIKNKIKTKSVKKAIKIAIVGIMALSLIMQSVAAFALEIVPVDDSLLADKSEWGNLIEYTDIDQNYSDKIYDRLKSANNNPELYLNDLDISDKERSNLTKDVKKVSEELIAKNIEDIDSDYEKEQFVQSLSEASEDTLESLKRADIIETYIDSETKTEEIIDPSLVRDNDTYVPLHTPHDLKIPRKSNDTLSLEFNSIKENKDSVAEEIECNISFKPVSANESTVSVEKNRAIYSNQWDNVDVVYTSNSDSVKEDIILKNNKLRQINTSTSGYQGDNDWIFYYQLDLTGLTPELTNNNQIEYKDENGAVVAVSTAPFMIDNKGEISKNAYFDLLTEEEFAKGYKIDKSKFDLTKKTIEETDLSTVVKVETDITVPVQEDVAKNNLSESDLSASAQTQGDSKGLFDFVIDVLKYVVNSVFKTVATTNAQELVDQTIVAIPDSSLSNEYDQTVAPIEKIGLEDQYPQQEQIEASNSYRYLALVVNTINLEYPIDIDPTTYVLTTTNAYNTANGLLLSNDVNDVKLYDTTTEPTSNYSYNKEIKSTLSLNNSIGAINSNDVVGAWMFDENDLTIAVEDDSATAAVGYIQNSASYTTGQVNSAIEFNGSDQYINIADNSSHSFVDSNFAISTWVNSDDFDDVNPVISKGSASNWEYVLYLSTDAEVVFTARQSNSTELYTVASPKGAVQANQWAHIVVNNFEDNEISIYINSDKIVTLDTSSVSNNMSDGTADLQIGRTADGGESYFDGTIDEVLLLDETLTQNQIQNIYENAKSKLIGWWNMSDNVDYSGHLNHGSYTGTTLEDNGQVASSRIFTSSDSFDLDPHYSLSPEQNLTVESWVKTDNAGIIAEKNNEYKLEICADGKPLFFVYANGQWQNTAGTADSCSGSNVVATNDSNWHHLAGSYDGKYMRLFLDGLQVAEYYFAGTIARTDSGLTIGSSYTGELDEVAIYNRALSQDELYAHTTQKYQTKINKILNFDNSIEFAEYSQLALDNLVVETAGVLSIKGTDLDGTEITEKMKLRAGTITRQLSSNKFKSITQLTALNEFGTDIGEKLQISQGSLIAFSTYHDSNWRHGISLADDKVTAIWHFDEGTGSIASDSSGTNNTGYLAGGQTGSWIYERTIDINPSTPVDDYQVELVLTPDSFDYNNAQDDGDDVRFFDNNGNSLSYWIEEWHDNGKSIIWINIPDSGTSTITMKYGNDSAISGVDGANTFDLFDDFDTESIDTDIWQSASGFTQSNGYLNGSSTTYKLTSNDTFTGNYVVHTRQKTNTEAGNGHIATGFMQSSSPTTNNYSVLHHPTNQWYSRNDSSWVGPYSEAYMNNWTTVKIKANSTSSTAQFYNEGTDLYSTISSNSNSGISGENLYLGGRPDGYTGQSYSAQWDWIYVRKYNATTPVLTVGGVVLTTEEYSSQPTWYNTSWNYRAAITIDNTDSPLELTDYQMPVYIDTSSLTPTYMQVDFDDVRFTEDDMTTPIDYSYDSSDSTTNSTKFIVEVPTIAASSQTTIYVYYGNVSASAGDNLDISDIDGLWHMDDLTDPTADSSDNSNNGQLGSTSGSSDSQDPIWDSNSGYSTFNSGNHLFFDGSDDYVKMSASTLPSVEKTASIWFYTNDTSHGRELFGWGGGGTCGTSFYAMLTANKQEISIGRHCYTILAVTLDAPLTNAWHKMTITTSASFGTRAYIDDELVGSTTDYYSVDTTSSDAYIGAIPNSNGSGYYTDSNWYTWAGRLDEFEVLDHALTTQEIQDEYYRDINSYTTPSITTNSTSTSDSVPNWSENGKYGSALSFDGTNDYVIVPDEDSLDATNQLSVGAWINPGALDGWIHSKALTISPVTGVDNLQLKLTLTPSSFDYINAASDGSDLRFADIDGTPIDYWIESYNPVDTSEIWLEIPQAGTSKIYMYYGNSGATSTSSFSNTFTKETNSSGLVAEWKMDEGSGSSTADSLGVSTGTLQSGVTWETTDGGVWSDRSDVSFDSGAHLKFDNTSNAEVTLGSDSSLQLSTFTYEGWIKRSSTGTQDILYAWGLGGPAIYLKTTNYLAIGKVGTWEQYSAGTITDTNWHHLVVTYEAPTIQYYIDGELDSTDTYATPGFTFTTSASLGVRADDNSGPMDGYMDNVRIYNRVLSADEITANYERRSYVAGNSELSLGSQQTGTPSSLYQRTISFDYPTSEDDYIAKIQLNTSNFDYSKTRLDGGDIRFYDAAGNSLDHYIDTWDSGGTSTIFVKVANQNTFQIYMQYGEKDVYSVSSGDDTLLLFDDYNDGQFDNSKWIKVREDISSWNEGVDIAGWFKLKALNGKNMSGDDASAPIMLSQQDFVGIDYEATVTVQFESDLSTPSVSYPETKTGLIVYQDDDNYLFYGLDYNETDTTQAVSIINESSNSPVSYQDNYDIPTLVDLKISKQNGQYVFSYKDHDSDTWIAHTTSISDASFAIEKLGIISYSGNSNDLPVYFDNFEVVKKYNFDLTTTLGSEETWGYKRSVSLSPATSSDLMQVQVVLDSSFPYSNVQTNGEDIRFYDTNFNKLNYWIEYWNDSSYSNSSSIWVKIPDEGTDQIYMYYGNSTADDESYGELVFPFFDSFDGTTIDNDTWTELDTASNYITQNDKIIFSGGPPAWGSVGMYTNENFDRSDEYELRFNYYPTGGTDAMFGWKDTNTGTFPYRDMVYGYYDGGAAHFVDIYEDGIDVYDGSTTTTTWANSTDFIISMPLKSDNGAIYRYSTDGGQTWNVTYNSTYSSESPLKIGFDNYARAFEIDNVFLLNTSAEASSATLDEENSWFYKRTVNLSSSTPSDDYQVKLTIGSSDIDYNNVNSDGSDIRFFDADGNQLSYWIERWAVGDTSIIWINIPDSGTSSFEMYYGNTSASSASNGQSTFDMFDDFEDGVLNTSEWSWTREVSDAWDEGQSQAGWLMIEALGSNNMWETDNSAPILSSQADFTSENYEVTVRTQMSPSADYQQGGLMVYEDDSNHVQATRGYDSGQVVTFKVEDTDSATASNASQSDTDVDLKIRKYDNAFRFYYKKHNHTDWIEFGSGTEYDLTMANQYLGLSSYADSGSDINTYFDDFRVNKISSINPSNDITATLAAVQAKDIDLDESKNIIKKGGSYSIGATDSEFYATLGSQIISADISEGWSHVMQVFDGTSQKLYINGELQSTQSYNQSLLPNTDELYIGEKYYGLIDDVVVSKTAFSDNDVQNIFESGQPYQKKQPISDQIEESSSADIVTDDLIGWWKMDEGTGITLADSVGSANATIYNSPTWVTGKNNNALKFNGTNSYARTSTVNLGSEFSFSFWMNPGELKNNNDVLSAGTFDYRMVFATYVDGHIVYAIGNGSSWGNYATSDAGLLEENTWYHVVGTYDGTNIKLYINNELIDSVVNTGLSLNQVLNIGARTSNSYYFDGILDDIRTYDRVLTTSEISLLAHEYDTSSTDDDYLSSSANITISGDQSSNYDKLAIRIDTAGQTGITTYKTSTDGGNSWSSATYTTSIEESNIMHDGVDTGVDITFDIGATFNQGDIFDIASWYTEERSGTRGISRSFPEVASIVATDNVTTPTAKSIEIIDANDNSLWMRFTTENTGGYLGGSSTNIGSIDMLYGQLFAGSNETDGIGVLHVDFINDQAQYYNSHGTDNVLSENIATRNGDNILTDNHLPLLNDDTINHVDATDLTGQIYLASASDDGVSLVNTSSRTAIDGTSGGDDIDKVGLSTDGQLYLANATDNNVLAIDNIQSYTQNFNFANYNELYDDTLLGTYQIPAEPINDLLVNESTSIADLYSSNKIITATDNGVGIVDTLTSILGDDSDFDNKRGFTKTLTSDYITESMNGSGLIKGMWITGDQTAVATVQDRSINDNDLLVGGFTSGNISDSDLDTGVRGSALVFDGNDRLYLTDNSDFNFSTTNNVSFGAWVNPAVSQTQTIFTQDNNFKLSTSNSAGKVVYEASINKNSTDYTASSNEYDLTDTWHYVVGVHDGVNNILKLFVDGDLENDITTPANYSINNPTGQIAVGSSSTGANYYQGKLQGVFITENVIMDSQIKQLYNIGLGALSDNDDDLNRVGGNSDAMQALAIDKDSNTLYVGTDQGLSAIDLDQDTRDDYWNTSSEFALPSNNINSLDYADAKVLVGTNSGTVLINTDGSYSNSSSVGELQSGSGIDVFTDGAYNYYVSDEGLDIVDMVNKTRKAYVYRDGGFNSVVAINGWVFMGTDDDGVYIGDVDIMDGETNIVLPTIHQSSSLPLSSDEVFDVHGRRINGINYLAVGTSNGVSLFCDYDTSDHYETYFKTNEDDDVTKVWLDEVGDLAYYNATDQTVNVFDGAINPDLYPYQGGTNSYDRQYSVTSTPNYIGQTVNDIVYTANTSTAEAGLNTLYIATNNGVSVVQEHSTQSSGTVAHYVSQKLHDERTGILLSFANSVIPESPTTNDYQNTINNYDPYRQKYFTNDDSLVGYWDFDQSLPAQIADRSGYGNHGGYGPNTGVSGGKIGNALYLDGTKSYMVVNDNKSLHPTNAFTWSGWVWKDSAISNDNTSDPILVSKYDSDNDGEFIIYYNKNNKIQIQVADGSSNDISVESSSVGTEAWHHVAVTFENGAVDIYIDGELDTTDTLTVTNTALPPYSSPADMTDLYIGNDWSVFDHAFGGYIDEVAYYTRALSLEEIQSQYSLPALNNSITVDEYDSLAYRTSANLVTNSGAKESLYLDFNENLSGAQGETFDLAVESSWQRPGLNMFAYNSNTNNNIVLDLGASGDWDDELVTNLDVIQDGNEYKMYYGGYDGTTLRFGLATSPDGINWTKVSNNCSGTTGNGCVFDDGVSLESNIVGKLSVIKTDNIYHMWYDGQEKSIAYATSNDGINWTSENFGNKVINTGTWDSTITEPTIIKEGGLFKMYYSGKADSGTDVFIGYATSTDGITWTKYDDTNVAACGLSEANDAGCLIDLGSSGAFDETEIRAGDITKINNKYYLAYTGYSSTTSAYTIGLMISDNGIDWERTNDGSAVLDLGVSADWNDANVYRPSIININNQPVIYYAGDDSTNDRIGLATLDYESGRYGKSLRIEDNDVYQYDITNDINRSQGAVSAWIKLDNASNVSHEVFNLQSSTTGDQDGLYLALQSYEITAGYNSEQTLISQNELTDDYWHQVVLTWDNPSLENDNFKLYLDGELVQSSVFDRNISQSYDQLQIGGNQGETRDYLDGNIDELRIYDQSLTADEVAELFNGSFGNSAKINTISQASEGSIEFNYTPDWDSDTDDEVRTLFDSLGGDQTRIGEQYLQSLNAFNRFKIWKAEGDTIGDDDEIHFSIVDNDGDLYEVYTDEDIDLSQDNEYKIIASWDLDSNDTTASGVNVMRLVINDTLVAGDDYSLSSIIGNKKKNGTDTDINEEITIDNIPEIFWIGSSTPSSSVNLVSNSSFESASSTTPTDWEVTGSIVYDNTGFNSKYGIDGASVTGPDTTNKMRQTVSIIPGTWTLSWWAKGVASDSTQDVEVQISDGSLTGTTGDNTDPGTTYKFYSITFVNDTYGDLDIDFSANTSETVWFDAVTLVQGSIPENYKTTSSIYSDFKISNYLPSEEEIEAVYLAETYDTTNDNASLAGETNNATSVGVKQVSTSDTASDDIMFVGTKGYTNEGALSQITFGSPDERTDEWRQDTSGESLTSNRVNSISYSTIRNNLAVATDDAGVFGFYDDVPAGITLSSPNGAEEWEGGSSQTVTWNTDFGECHHIDLSYSTDSGTSFDYIAQNLDDTGSYLWDPVTSLDSNNVTVKVACIDPFSDELSTDTSDASMIVDSTSPEFTLYNIPNPSGDNIVFVRGAGTDSGGATSITEVNYKVDEGDWQVANINSGSGTTSVEFDFSTTALSTGEHTIYVKGKDSSLPNGNETDLSTAAQRTFNVDSLSISFDKTAFDFDLSVNGNQYLSDSLNITVTGYGTDYSLGIKSDQAPTNRYYQSETIPFYTGDDDWSSNSKGFGWKNTSYNSGYYNDFDTSAYEIFKSSFASLVGDTTTVDFKAAVDWSVPAGDYESTVTIIAIPRY